MKPKQINNNIFKGKYYPIKKGCITENKSKNNIEKYKILELEPSLVPVNYYDNKNIQQKVFIYTNFELLEKEIVSFFLNGNINDMREYDCLINEGKIIMNYPNEDNNKDYISVIGTLNNENNFINEYILIFGNKLERKNAINEIIKNIKKYINNLQLFNGQQPIINNDYKEIGIIIKFEQNIDKSDSINYINQYDDNNIFFDQNDILNSHDIKNYFQYPPLIGLKNVGAACYMNATLQCFCHIEKLVDFFKYSKQVRDIALNNRNSLSYSFKLLIENLWPNNYNAPKRKKYYYPEEFKNKISEIYPLFDAKVTDYIRDFVNSIIIILHQELNKSKNNNKNNNNLKLDQGNSQVMFNYFSQNFIANNQSIISDLFYGIKCNIIKCFNCQCFTYDYQAYIFLEFPLLEVLKFKGSNQSNTIIGGVDIYDCLEYDSKVDLMYEDNSIYCKYCNLNFNHSINAFLTTGPEILIILLNRGLGNEFNFHVNFYENLNLTNFIEYKNTGSLYKLIGVISYVDDNMVAFCNDPINNFWHKYKDEIVEEVKDFKKEVIDQGIPFLLLYQKSNQ